MHFEAASQGKFLSALVALVVLFFRVDGLVICHAMALRRSIVASPTLKPAELEMSIQVIVEIGFVTAHLFSALMA